MVDVQTILAALRSKGHTVAYPTPIPENAGDYEFTVDGRELTLAEVRALLETESPE